MIFHVKILVYLKEGVLDTQGKAVAKALVNAGHDELVNTRVGKYIQLWINAGTQEEAYTKAEVMCDEILVNELIEDFDIEVEHSK